MKVNLILPILILLVTGCSTTSLIPMTENNAEKLVGKSLILTSKNPPSFMAFSPSKGFAGALVGFSIAQAAGDAIVEHNNIQDPAIYIGDHLLSDVAANYQMSVDDAEVKLTEDKGISNLSTTYEKYNYVLNVNTLMWSYIYYPTNWNRYKVTYIGKL